MADPTSLSQEQQEILISLKQLFTAVECEVNKAAITPQIFHDILIHLEQTHEHFHRFEFVKILQNKIDTSLSAIIESELNKRPNSDPLDVIPEVTDVVFNSPEFNTLQESFCLSMQEIIDVMVEIYHDPIRWEVGTPFFKDKNYVSNDDLSSSSNQTGCMFFTSDQYFQIAQNLDPGMPKHVRQNALNCLFKTAPGECEHWSAIRQGIMDGLADDDYNFAEESLSLHAKLFNSGTSYSTSELYTSLSGHLIQHFQSSATYHIQMRNGLDTANKNTRCILRRFMLLSIFQHDITTFWIRCPERHMIQPITQTIELLSLAGPEDGCLKAVQYLCLFDHKALWFKKWLHGCFTRNLVTSAMKKFNNFLKSAIECVSAGALPDVAPKDIYSSFTYSWRQLKYLEFIHSTNVIANIVQYKAGRELICEASSGNANGVIDIFNKLIRIMTMDNSVFNLMDSSFHPQTIISELLKEIIVSGEECRKLLSHEVILKTFMQPLLDIQSCSSKCVQVVCDILSLLGSYCVGISQLINTHVNYKGTNMSIASVIGEQCQQLLIGCSGKNLTEQRDKEVLSALLFFARQIYTTHEGLAVMSRFKLVARAHEAASTSRDKTPQPPVLSQVKENKVSENCLEEVLVDNMLGFASTPRGLVLLYKGSMLDQCIDYLYQRRCKKLQVSKTQKFGYGYMVSQIVGIPAGLQALERCGFIRQLSQNLWWLLENGGPPTSSEVPVTQPPDPYFEGAVLKALTSLIQVLISYDSLQCILTSSYTLVNLDPDLYRQPEPNNIHDILQRIIFIDSPLKSKSLMNFELMQIFGLRILSILLSCLDTLLYFVENYDILNYLAKCQGESKVEGKIVIDDATIERNIILVRSSILGGFTEKVVPPRLTKDIMSQDYPYSMADSLNIPECYISQPPLSSEAKADVKLSAMPLTDNESDSWLDKTRSFVLAVCRKPSFTGHVGLVEVVLKYQLQENSAPFTQIEPDNDSKKAIPIMGLEYGCKLIVEYGIRLKILPPSTKIAPLKSLCQVVASALTKQQHSHSTSFKFDWFVGVVYLLYGGRTDRALSLLSSLSTTLCSGYLWTLRLLNSKFINSNIASSGLTVIHYNACHCMERVLQRALPKVACAFRISGMSPTHLVKRWINASFLNILPWNEICNYVLIVVSEGPSYIVLFCIALLKHLETRLLQHSTRHTLLYNVLEEPVQGFTLANYLDYIISLDKEFGSMLRADLRCLDGSQ